MALSENLQRLRKKAGLSQEDVAEKLFVSRQSISKWENGNAEPGVDHLKALARLYGVTLDELMENESVPETKPTPEAKSTPETEPAPTEPWVYRPMVKQTRAKPREEPIDNKPYDILVTVRIFVALITGLISLVAYSQLPIPFDLVAMVLGTWVTTPTMWAVIVCLELFNGLISCPIALFRGDAMSIPLFFFYFICVFVMFHPAIKARFHRE